MSTGGDRPEARSQRSRSGGRHGADGGRRTTATAVSAKPARNQRARGDAGPAGAADQARPDDWRPRRAVAFTVTARRRTAPVTMEPSIGSVGDACGNAMAESRVGAITAEQIQGRITTSFEHTGPGILGGIPWSAAVALTAWRGGACDGALQLTIRDHRKAGRGSSPSGGRHSGPTPRRPPAPPLPRAARRRPACRATGRRACQRGPRGSPLAAARRNPVDAAPASTRRRCP